MRTSFYIYIALLRGLKDRETIYRSIYKGCLKPSFQNNLKGKSVNYVVFRQTIHLFLAKLLIKGEYDGMVVVDKDTNFDNDRKEYLSQFFNTYNPYIHSIGQRFALNFYSRFKLGVSYIFLYPLFFLLYFIVDRRKLLSIAWELGSTLSIIETARSLKLKEIIAYGSAYNSSMNLLAYVSRKRRIKLTKICSANPLYIHYKYNVTDTFICVSPSQIEELENEEYVKHWYVNKITSLPNPKQIQLRPYLRDVRGVSRLAVDTIAFVSSGFYIREYRNHQKVSGEGFYKAEELLIDFLNRSLAANKQRLIVLLHPLEKKIENYEVACEYYAQKFKDINYSISDIGANSLEYITKADIFVSSSSTLNFDLLYCGAKVLFAPLGNNDARFPNYSTLKNISSIDSQELEELLIRVNAQTLADYYLINSLTQFHHSESSVKEIDIKHISRLY